MIAEHSQKLVLERKLAVMRYLIVYVSHNQSGLRHTDRERSVSILPMKFHGTPTVLVDVFAGTGFELPNKVRDSGFRRNAYQQMSVVEVSTDTNRMAIQIVTDTGHVCPNGVAKIIVGE